jgi:hypothetical protein
MERETLKGPQIHRKGKVLWVLRIMLFLTAFFIGMHIRHRDRPDPERQILARIEWSAAPVDVLILTCDIPADLEKNPQWKPARLPLKRPQKPVPNPR